MNSFVYAFLTQTLCLIEPFLWNWFLEQVITEKVEMKRWKKSALLILCVSQYIPCIVTAVFPKLYFVNSYSVVVGIILYGVYGMLFYNTKVEQIFLYDVLQYAIYLLVEYIFMFVIVNIFSIDMSTIFKLSGMRLVAIAIDKALDIVAFFALIKIMKKYRRAIKTKNIVLILIMGLVCITFSRLVLYIHNNSKVSIIFDMSTLAMLLSEATIITGAIFLLIQARKKEMEHLNAMKFVKTQLAMANEVQKNSDDMMKIRHDLKNHLCAINILLKKGDVPAAEFYIDNLLEGVNVDGVLKMENTILAVVLYEKIEKAKKMGIDIKCELDVSDILIPPIELNAIIGNMMENSIEACMKIEDVKKRKILFQIFLKDDDMIVECRNTYAEKPFINKKGLFETSKMDKIRHGYGIQIINEYVEKNQGEMDIRFNQGEFIIKAVFSDELGVRS